MQNEDKSEDFFEAFFPVMNTPDSSPPALPELESPRHLITELELERPLKAAKGATAPGEDN